ncbi:GRIP1-associated protein 1 [Trichoplax sp. H2]|nr:GRIP1-associated protein 1 [Trichoplax sp. H2]|eukprot:RDD46078.1 GRIP1-associated protein 1 [Trichoplax sp. H2]
MSEGIVSTREFILLQKNLKELKSKNAQLQDSNNFLEKEAKNLRDKLDKQNYELNKATKLLAKSKKAKELADMAQELELTKQQMEQLQEESNVQTQTLNVELSRLVKENEGFRRQLDSYQGDLQDYVTKQQYQSLMEEKQKFAENYELIYTKLQKREEELRDLVTEYTQFKMRYDGVSNVRCTPGSPPTVTSGYTFGRRNSIDVEEDIRTLLYRSVEKEIGILTKLEPTVLFQTIRNSTEGEFDFLVQELNRCVHKAMPHLNKSSASSSPAVVKDVTGSFPALRANDLISFQQSDNDLILDGGNAEIDKSVPATNMFSSLDDFDPLNTVNNPTNSSSSQVYPQTNSLTPTLSNTTEFTPLVSAYGSSYYQAGDYKQRQSEEYNNANISPTIYANAPNRFQFPSSGIGSTQSLSLPEVANKEAEVTENRIRNEMANLIQKCRSRIESQICYLLGISGIIGRSNSSSAEPIEQQENDLGKNLDTYIQKLKDYLVKELAEKKSLKQELLETKDSITSEIAVLQRLLKEKDDELSSKQVRLDQIDLSMKKKVEEFQNLIVQKDQEIQKMVEAFQRVNLELQEDDNESVKSDDKALPVQNTVQADEGTKFREVKQELSRYKKKFKELEIELKQAKYVNDNLMENIHSMEQEVIKLKNSLDKANEVAQRRKSILDNMTVEHQRDSNQYKEEIESLQDELQEIRQVLHSKSDIEQDFSKELGQKSALIGKLQDKIKIMDNDKRQTDQMIINIRNDHEKNETSLKSELEEVKDDLVRVKDSYELQWNEKEKENETLVENLQKVVGFKDQEIEQMKRMIEDLIADRRTVEKKSHDKMKDIRRLLKSERKRSDQLTEVLNYQQNTESTGSIRTSNISLNRVGSQPSLPTENNPIPSNDMDAAKMLTRNETKELLERVSKLQQTKRTLESRVQILEESGASLAEELTRKTKIFEGFVLQKRSAKPEPQRNIQAIESRLLEFVKYREKGDEGLREMNAKLQRVLEETIIKNLSLQKNIEEVSTELVKERARRTHFQTS